MPCVVTSVAAKKSYWTTLLRSTDRREDGCGESFTNWESFKRHHFRKHSQKAFTNAVVFITSEFLLFKIVLRFIFKCVLMLVPNENTKESYSSFKDGSVINALDVSFIHKSNVFLLFISQVEL